MHGEGHKTHKKMLLAHVVYFSRWWSVHMIETSLLLEPRNTSQVVKKYQGFNRCCLKRFDGM